MILECIEVAHPDHEASAAAKPAKSQGLEQPSKMLTQGVRILRKPKHGRTETTCIEKNCNLCKKHGDVHTEHNTAECHCYKKDGTPMQETTSHQGKNSGSDQNSMKSFAQVLSCIEKLEKSLKKSNKRGKKRRHHEESDSYSNSS